MEPVADGVGDRAAGHHALQRACHDRDLGRAAGGGARHGVGQVYEEVRYARALKEGAEDDEHHDELGADVDRRGEDALRGVEEAVDDGVEALAARKGVYEQRARHEEYGQAHAAAAELREHEHTDYADDVVGHRHADGAREHAAQVVVGEAVVEERRRAQDHEHDVVPRQGVDLDVLLAGRVGQEAEDHDAAHEGGEAYLDGGPGGKRGVDAVGREERHEDIDDELGSALPDARVRLAVVLAHDGLDVLHRAHVGGLVLLRLEGRPVKAFDVRMLVVRLLADVGVDYPAVEQAVCFLFLLRHCIPPLRKPRRPGWAPRTDASSKVRAQAVGTVKPCSSK